MDSIPVVSTSIQLSTLLPVEANMDFRDTSYFQKFDSLPTTKEVQERAQAQCSSGTNIDPRKEYQQHFQSAPPATWESMRLLVKWGGEIRMAEALSMYAVRNLLGPAVPVPEVYGWRTDNQHTYIYMELVSGQTLKKSWDGLNDSDRAKVARELGTIVGNLRMLKQDPNDSFIGSIDRSWLSDKAISFQYRPEAGPFPTVKAFHDWYVFQYRRPFPDQASIPQEPFRNDLLDYDTIKFTHSDLHRSNIIVSHTRPPRIVAVVDWEQSAWLPAYWESCKARYSVWESDVWSKLYIPMFIEKSEENDKAYSAWGWYSDGMGAF